jgi:general secretion pathway protein D
MLALHESRARIHGTADEQPFFHVRSVQTQLSVYNGATVVMGGLITEDRKTMEDKIPFLGDIPYLGRLFRSRSEQSIKRNLLVFVTARLVDPAGRVVKTGGESALLAAGASSTPSAPVAAPVAAPEGGAEPNAAAIQ